MSEYRNSKEHSTLKPNKENTAKTGKFSLSFSVLEFAISPNSDKPFRKERL
jgi:hypothetical protein